MGPPELSTRGLSRRFGRHWAVQELDMRAPAGKATGFVGPNGAGKSTTMRLLLGLIRPTAGEARIGEHVVRGGPDSLPVRVRALVERPAFHGSLSGFENLQLLANLTARVPDAEVDAVLARLGLASARDARVGGYSTGMLQRLGLALCLLGRPDAILLDEPTSGLDPEFRVTVREVVNELRARGDTTLLISSHLLAELEEMVDHLVLIREGRAVVQGAVPALLAATGAASFRVRALPLEVAREVLADLAPVEAGGALVISLSREQMPERVAALVARGVRVYEVAEQRRSLEELYIGTVPGKPA